MIMDKFSDKALASETVIKHSVIIPHLPTKAISFRSPHERITRNVINEINRAQIGHEAESYLKKSMAI